MQPGFAVAMTPLLVAATLARRLNPVPFLLGSNSHETPIGPITERQKLPLKGLDVTPLIAAYGGEKTYADHIGSDVSFTEQARSLADMHRKNGHVAFLYLFGVVSAEDAAAGKGAEHAAELRYVFDTLATGKTPITDPVSVQAAKAMNRLWRAFAATGGPLIADAPLWLPYDGKRVMQFTRDGLIFAPDPRNARLDALHKLLDPRS